MKEIRIIVRLDEMNNQIGHIFNHKGFGEDNNINLILTTIGILDNFKQQFLNKLNSKSKVL